MPAQAAAYQLALACPDAAQWWLKGGVPVPR